MQPKSISIPTDAVTLSQLTNHFPELKTSYIRGLTQQPTFPKINFCGRVFVSVSEFRIWYTNYKATPANDQRRRIQAMIKEKPCTRAMLETSLNIRINNVCRVVQEIKERLEKSQDEYLKIEIGTCPITKRAGVQFLSIEKREEAR